MGEGRLASLVLMNYHYSVRFDADGIVRVGLLTGILAVRLVQLQVLLSDCYLI